VRRNLLRYSAFFTLGILVGAIAMTLLLGRDIEHLTYKTRVQQEELTEATQQLRELKASLEAARQKPCIRGIDVRIRLAGGLTEIEEQGVRIELEREVKERLKPLMERELATLNYWLIPGMINERVAEVEGKQFEMHVDMIIVAETLGVTVRAKFKELKAAL
jgi:hypothetical protein